MSTLIFAFLTMLFLVAAMAVGVAFGRKPIAGSCGGMKALGMEVECEVCGGQPELCESPNPLVQKWLDSRAQNTTAEQFESHEVPTTAKRDQAEDLSTRIGN